MNQENNSIEPIKQKYEAPRVITISLRPEEAVLGHCKMAGSSGPVALSCAVLHCSSIGS
jgi:hypothetical protein